MSFPSASTTDLVALDIGGANLKAADGLGWAVSTPFAMWREWRRLADAVAAMIGPRSPRRVVATMTGEIADCFSSRAEGVRHIVAAVAAAAGAAEVGVYCVDGEIVGAADACAAPLRAAASNWHAVARLAGSVAPTDRVFLIDVGSTTVDIIPLCDGRPVPRAEDDAGRMLAGELVYTGTERTPLAALVSTLPHRGARRPVASERFAESRDAWLVLGALPADEADRDTADGGPATPDAARIRLARTMLLEPESFTAQDALLAAERCAAAQARLVARALRRVADGVGWIPTAVVLSGHGDPLADRALAGIGWNATRISLRERFGADVSRSAPAHAVALIARGMIR